VQGPQGSAGSFLASQPRPLELLKDVVEATTAVSPRILIDPREGVRYVTTIASKLMKVQGSLMLRAMLVSDEAVEDEDGDWAEVRSIA
jgi:hypothetical protein